MDVRSKYMSREFRARAVDPRYDFFRRHGYHPSKRWDPSEIPHERRAALSRIRKPPVGCLYGYVAAWNCSPIDDRGTEIEAGAFSDWLKKGIDCAVLIDHDLDQLLGRKSDLDLFLAEDSSGLYFEFKLPDSTFGDRVKRALALNPVLGMSFFYAVREQEYIKGVTLYRQLDLSEISILVSHPTGANPGAWARLAGHKNSADV